MMKGALDQNDFSLESGNFLGSVGNHAVGFDGDRFVVIGFLGKRRF